MSITSTKIETNLISEKDFLNWYTSFATTGKIISGIDFYQDVNKAQENIRKNIGGVELSKIIHLKDATASVPYEDIAEMVERLIVILGYYFYTYELRRSDLISPTISRMEKFVGMKWSKHIATFMDQQKGTQNEVPEDIKNEVNVIMSKMGEKWAQAKTQEIDLKVTISTDPRAYCMLGHFGLDQESCFKQGGQNNQHKYRLGITPNGYVGIVSPPDVDWLNHKDKLLSRFWGVANDTLDRYGVVNLYFGKNQVQGNILTGIEEFFKDFNPKLIRQSSLIAISSNIFQNKIINWTFDDEKYRGATLAITGSGSNFEVTKCSECSVLRSPERFNLVDGRYFCKDCCEKLAVCYHSKQKHINLNLIEAILPDGQKVKISNRYVNNYHYGRCCVDEKVYKFSMLKIIDGYYALPENVKHQCPKCKKPTLKLIQNNKLNSKVCSGCNARSNFEEAVDTQVKTEYTYSTSNPFGRTATTH